MISHEYHRIALDKITVPTDRQRKEVRGVEALAASISRNGLIHPICLARDNTLVSGGCRLAAFKHLAQQEPDSLKWKLIPAIYLDELDLQDRKIIELEENIKRSDLTWQEEALATLDYMDAKGEDYKVEDAAVDLSLSVRHVYTRVAAGRAIKAGDKMVSSCASLGAAENLISRRQSRAIDDELERLMAVSTPADPTPASDPMTDLDLSDLVFTEAAAPEAAEPTTTGDYKVTIPRPYNATKLQTEALALASSTFLCRDFRAWARDFQGERFNFIHCDFPYGIGFDKSDQGNSDAYGSYEDTEDNFWKLLDALLEYKDNFIAKSAHIMFWFPITRYQKILKAFTDFGMQVNPVPLIWHKANNIGITPDVNRRPRQVYETAFIITQGDRKFVRSYPNLVAANSNKRDAKHASEKPYPMLQSFFMMLVDETTTFLDPTCGSGNALLAAFNMKAKRAFGMDINAEYVRAAKQQFAQHVVTSRSQGAEKLELDSYDEEEPDPLFDDTQLDLDLEGPTDEELQDIELGKIGVLDDD